MSTGVAEREAPGAGAEEGDEPAPSLARMGIAMLALLGLGVSAYLTLFKLGYLGTIQCGTAGGCETVQTSQYAYFLGVPVAVWGLAAYGAILAVALVGVQPRWVESRGVALALFVMGAGGVAFSAYLTYLEAFVIHAWCRWCVVSAILVTLIFLLSLPGLKRAR